MTHDDLNAKSLELLAALQDSDDTARKAALPALQKHLSDLKIAGLRAPINLKELEQEICDLSIEDMFDNLPL